MLFAIVAVAACFGLLIAEGRLGIDQRLFGTVFPVGWCLGLMIWSLAIVRKHSSQFGLCFVLLGVAAVGLFLAALRMFPPYVPGLFTLGAFSLCMLTAAVSTSTAGDQPQGLTSRGLTGMAGAFGMAHVLRVMFHFIMD